QPIQIAIVALVVAIIIAIVVWSIVIIEGRGGKKKK
nr:Chain A, VPU protein [Human immunodeficiency virus 1]2GOH_A Chain A, VPU protein [Human immunodeficiency virus 1]